MQITFGDLASAAKTSFPLVAWHLPSPGTPTSESARQLLYTARTLATRLPGELVGQRVALVSQHAGDWVLARLLVCCGAEVHFYCQGTPDWDDEVHQPLFQTLLAHIEAEYPYLDYESLEDHAARQTVAANNLAIESLDGNTPPVGQGTFDIVYLRDLLHGAGRDQLDQLVGLANTGATIEIFGKCRDPQDVAEVETLVRESGLRALGPECAAWEGRWPGPYRISFMRLSEPVYEFPRGEEDTSLLMAHCEARLRFAAKFVRGARVLEAGCGMGIGARLFRQAGAEHVVGLDYRAEALARAQSCREDPRIDLRQWDLNTTPLPLASEEFDVVICLEVLEHIHNQAPLLEECHRILKPGGRLIISVPNKEFEDEWAEHNRCHNPYHVAVPTGEEFETLLSPFSRVTYARQMDLIGSVVLEEGRTLPGEFSIQSPHAMPQTSEVRLAICVKAPLGAAAVTPQPEGAHLCVYDNHLATQLDRQRYMRQLEVALAEARLDHWRQQNRSRLDTPQEQGQVEETPPSQEAVNQWVASGSAAFSSHIIAPGDWMSRLSRAVERALLLRSVRGGHRRRSKWWIAVSEERHVRLGPLDSSGSDCAAVVFPRSEAGASALEVCRWGRAGAKEVWFLEAVGWKRVDMAALLARRLYKLLTRCSFGLARRMRMTDPVALSRVVVATQAALNRPGIAEVTYSRNQLSLRQCWFDWIRQTDAEVSPTPADGALRILEYTGSLFSGGAERQLCNVALGMKQRGDQVTVLTSAALTEGREHYKRLLTQGGVEVHAARKRALTASALRTYPWHLLQNVPVEIQELVLNLAAEISAYRPDVLHCWLDQPNIIGGIAGLLAGVPAIVLSTRNANPTVFPRLNSPYLREWYQTLALSRRTHFIANSRFGAASYAQWLDLPRQRFHVIWNGLYLHHFPVPDDAKRRSARRKWGLSDTNKVVVGAFRLDEEKQPELFLDVVRQVRQQIPQLQVLLAGTGALEERVKDAIHQHEMTSYVQMLGRRKEIGEVLLSADMTLLTSSMEGCPNILLESQHLGVPVVATDVGGTTDCVMDGRTGFLRDVSEVGELAECTARLLNDDSLRRQFSAAAPGFVKDRFELEKMLAATRHVFTEALASRSRGWTELGVPHEDAA